MNKITIQWQECRVSLWNLNCFSLDKLNEYEIKQESPFEMSFPIAFSSVRLCLSLKGLHGRVAVGRRGLFFIPAHPLAINKTETVS